ncbi:MAG: DNA-directed RNA polymerase subunit L [Nanoarchaeota archaeon]|nr:DNA-directed RNA polymerase subunit L [Nanoarchaeota archaeon]MBU1270048.1 DNA-directed RNA polymerase subunit L [Nanoarchaeota archaeon]MBU1604248.1 DNA-directed RNA polymerase subunit L [Nanoarchaeota archaeon]MBU2443784.1 DNA-directed RNA polymerase subunit L [Nanoarchaeota archaeon]
MEIKFIEDTKYKVIFDIKGTSHTLANSLKKELWNDEDVKVAAYNVEHPLIGIPRVIVETSAGKKDARTAVLDAIDRLKKKNKDLASKFNKAL